MNLSTVLLGGLMAVSLVATALAGDDVTDTYAGGTALCVLPQEFVLAGGVTTGVNFD